MGKDNRDALAGILLEMGLTAQQIATLALEKGALPPETNEEGYDIDMDYLTLEEDGGEKWRKDMGWSLDARLDTLVCDLAEFFRPYNTEFFRTELEESDDLVAQRQTVGVRGGGTVATFIYCRNREECERLGAEADFAVDTESGRVSAVSERAAEIVIKGTEESLLINIINQFKKEKIMEKENEKIVCGSVYVARTGTDSEGREYERTIPNYQLQVNMDVADTLTADSEGYVHFSIHERKDADKLAAEKKPTHFLQLNTYKQDGEIDLYSVKDISVKLEDLKRLAKAEEFGGQIFNKAYVTALSDGTLMSTKGRYENQIQLEGRAFEVNAMSRRMDAAKEKASEQNLSLSSVGIAWEIAGKDGGKFYSVRLDGKKLAFVPVDAAKDLCLALQPLKERKSDKAPTHTVVVDSAFLTGRLSQFSDVEFKIKKSDALKKEYVLTEKTTYKDKEYEDLSTYINISEKGDVRLNKSKYENLADKDGKMPQLDGASAVIVDHAAREAEIERRVEAYKERQAKREESKTQAETQSKGGMHM